MPPAPPRRPRLGVKQQPAVARRVRVLAEATGQRQGQYDVVVVALPPRLEDLVAGDRDLRTKGLHLSEQRVQVGQVGHLQPVRRVSRGLGLPPLNQYDAAARPMFQSFRNTPDAAPYQHVPAQIDPDATNDRTAYGADRSLRMDFSEYDKVDDFELNDILWHAVMGQEAPLPPAVRRAIAFRSQRPK
jgi:hypothetical protein